MAVGNIVSVLEGVTVGLQKRTTHREPRASWMGEIQDQFPLGLTGLISLQSKGLSRVFSNTKFQKHQFFGAQPSLWPNSHNYTHRLNDNNMLCTTYRRVVHTIAV